MNCMSCMCIRPIRLHAASLEQNLIETGTPRGCHGEKKHCTRMIETVRLSHGSAVCSTLLGHVCMRLLRCRLHQAMGGTAALLVVT